jgi:UDP-glucose 4-epimerase
MAFGLPYVALRYANIYGPRQSGAGEAGVVAIFISQLLAGKAPILNGDGKQTRDYVFVGDVVKANLAALETNFVGPVNIGTGIETDVVTLCEELRRGVGSPIEGVHGPAKPGEQRRSCLDASLAGKVLGWKPEVTLEAGLAKTVEYYRGSGVP